LEVEERPVPRCPIAGDTTGHSDRKEFDAEVFAKLLLGLLVIHY